MLSPSPPFCLCDEYRLGLLPSRPSLILPSGGAVSPTGLPTGSSFLIGFLPPSLAVALGLESRGSGLLVLSPRGDDGTLRLTDGKPRPLPRPDVRLCSGGTSLTINLLVWLLKENTLEVNVSLDRLVSLVIKRDPV